MSKKWNAIWMIIFALEMLGVSIWLTSLLRFPIQRHDIGCTIFGVLYTACFYFITYMSFKVIPRRWRR